MALSWMLNSPSALAAAVVIAVEAARAVLYRTAAADGRTATADVIRIIRPVRLAFIAGIAASISWNGRYTSSRMMNSRLSSVALSNGVITVAGGTKSLLSTTSTLP